MKTIFSIAAVFALVVSTASDANVSDVQELTEAAPIALMIDAKTGQVLYSRNADRRFIPASITKIMTTYVAFEMIKDGTLRLDQEFALPETLAGDWYRKGSTMFLEPGEPASVDDLLRGITSVSANDGSIALAAGAGGSVDKWLARMNSTARKLGMTNSHFGTPNGWPDEGATFTTAADLAFLSRALVREHPVLYDRYFGNEGMRYNGFAQANHDPITGRVEGADGIKTGYTRQAGHGFVGSATRDGSRLIMVVAGVGGGRQRNKVSREFMEWGFDEFRRVVVFAEGQQIGTAVVQDSETDAVGLIVPNAVSLAVSQDTPDPMFAIVNYEGPLEAPIKRGAKVGLVEIRSADRVVARIPIVAAQSVIEAGPFQRIRNAFSEWFS